MSFKILRAALEGPESEMDVIFKSKHRESTMSRDDMVKIKSELSDSVDCTICKTRISIDTATDIYTKVSNCSHRLFSSLISRITNIVFHQDDFSKFMCKHCFCLLLKIDETEQAYLRLKREFHDMCIRAIGDGTSNYPELYKTVSTQTDDGTRSHNMYSEFCSVEEKDNEATAQLNPPSPAPSIPMNDTYYDSDSEPLSKKKPKKDRKTKKSRKIKQKSRTVSNYTCHECGKTFGTKLTLTEHTLYDHIVEDVKDIQVDFNLKEDIGKRKASKRKVESDVEILLNHIKEENTTDAISNDENNLDDDDKDDVPIMPILDEETSTSSAGIILRKRRSKARLKQEYLEGEYFDDDMTDSNYEYIKPREGPARRNHLPRNRLPKQVFQCPECPETFKSKARMQYHADKHGVGKPPYICEVCGASYKNKKACDIHVGMHKGISPWKCDLCSKLFPSKGALQRHEAIHTGKTNYQNAMDKPTSSTGRINNNKKRVNLSDTRLLEILSGYKSHDSDIESDSSYDEDIDDQETIENIGSYVTETRPSMSIIKENLNSFMDVEPSLPSTSAIIAQSNIQPIRVEQLPEEEVPLENISEEVEDEEIYTWSTPEDITHVDFVGEPGLKVPILGDEPIDYLNLLLNDEFYNLIITHTNGHAVQILSETVSDQSRITSWRDVTKEEIKIFLGILFHMGTIRLNRTCDYWKKDYLFNIPVFRKFMSRNRFLIILRVLYFQNSTDTCTKKASKILSLVNLYNKIMNEIYNPEKELSIDESIVLWRGRFILRQHIKEKRRKYGIRLYVLAEHTGLCLKIHIYEGKFDTDVGGLDHGRKVVYKLMDGKLEKGHTLYMDNVYNSVSLAKKLLTNKTYCTGTLRSDILLNTPEITGKNLKRGESITRYSQNGICICKWKDNKRDVLALSTEHTGRMVGVRTRRGMCKTKPKLVIKYNQFMRGVDRHDQMLSYYSSEHKSIRWYKKIAIHIFQSMMINAYYLYNKGRIGPNKMSLYEFRLSCIKSLLGRPPIAPEVPKPQNIHCSEPYPMTNAKGQIKTRRCKQCYSKKKRRETVYYCSQCPDQPALCVHPCFREFHNY